MADSLAPTADQIRAGRALVKMSQEELAARTGVPRSAIAEFEAGARSPRRATLASLEAALEAAGVVFIAADGLTGVGIRTGH